MKILKVILVIFLICPINFVEADINDMRHKITKNLRCLICQGQSVYDSDSEFANSLKLVVDKKLNDGLSEDQIYDYLKNKYGEWILYDPEMNRSNLLLWTLPLILFVFGSLLIFKKVSIK
tara:strand:+ start:693 stop:1052 length:360 start_codon:yes stop_codon:yes gene_type:complete